MTHRLITKPKPVSPHKRRIVTPYSNLALWAATSCILLAAACVPAFADAHYMTEIHWNGDAAFEAWVSGANGRFEVKNSTDPSFPNGAIIYTQDNGSTAYLFSPDSSECVKTTSDQLVDFKRSQIKKMRITAEDLKVEHLTDEDGPEMFGFKTHHARLRITVTIHVPSGPIVQTYQLSIEQDYWTAPDIHETPANLALFTASTSGIQLLDDAVTGELSKIPGFPLKRLVAATSLAHGQSTDMGQSVVKVTDLAVGPADKALFDLPKSCQQPQ